MLFPGPRTCVAIPTSHSCRSRVWTVQGPPLVASHLPACGIPTQAPWETKKGGSLSHLTLCFVKWFLRCIWVPCRGPT